LHAGIDDSNGLAVAASEVVQCLDAEDSAGGDGSEL
jgi:hypothetical protein